LKRIKYHITQTPQLSNTLGLKKDFKGTVHMAHIRYKITFCLLVNLKESCIIPLTEGTHPNYLRWMWHKIKHETKKKNCWITTTDTVKCQQRSASNILMSYSTPVSVNSYSGSTIITLAVTPRSRKRVRRFESSPKELTTFNTLYVLGGF
jgi:hypothetical protein